MYFATFAQDVFANSGRSDMSYMVTTWMVILSALAATLTTIFAGTWSDRKGRRKPFIAAGYIFWGFTIMLFAFLPMKATGRSLSLVAELIVLFDCIMTFAGSTSNDAAFNAWITDNTDETNCGKINDRINELLKQSVKSDGVLNLFSDVGEKVNLFDPTFLENISKMKEKNLAVEMLRKLIEEQVKVYKRTNLVKSEKFSEIVQQTLNRYLNGMLTNDWQKKESARASMRRLVKRLLKKYDYPPDGQEDALKTVISQCEMWTDTIADFNEVLKESTVSYETDDNYGLAMAADKGE